MHLARTTPVKSLALAFTTALCLMHGQALAFSQNQDMNQQAKDKAPANKAMIALDRHVFAGIAAEKCAAKAYDAKAHQAAQLSIRERAVTAVDVAFPEVKRASVVMDINDRLGKLTTYAEAWIAEKGCDNHKVKDWLTRYHNSKQQATK
uniref:Uncharacterized protein n=1 Tax=Magnetococcus massalia (strain MO-1) TaxID=451514 RepID=A0A1S7LC62_MAGMO|nr:Exported protein of unknown function [Candidatus Magnetococcus massalia]